MFQGPVIYGALSLRVRYAVGLPLFTFCCSSLCVFVVSVSASLFAWFVSLYLTSWARYESLATDRPSACTIRGPGGTPDSAAGAATAMLFFPLCIHQQSQQGGTSVEK